MIYLNKNKHKLTRTQQDKLRESQKKNLQPLIECNKKLRQYGYCDEKSRSKIFNDLIENGFMDFKEYNCVSYSKYMIKQSNTTQPYIKEANVYESQKEHDTRNLSIGMEIKNYNLLCELLGEKPTTGVSKMSQMNDWTRCFDYVKLKYSNIIIIIDIYPIPFPRAAKKSSKYMNLLSVLLLNEFIGMLNYFNNSEETLITKYNDLAQNLGLTNGFLYDNKNQNAIEEFLYVKSESYIDEKKFHTEFVLSRVLVRSRIRNYIQNTLDRLMKDNIIYYDEFIQIEHNKKTHYASPKEKSYIQDIEEDIAKSLGFNLARKAKLYKYEEFYRLFDERVMEDKGWERVETILEIHLERSRLVKPISEYTSYQTNYTINEISYSDIIKFQKEFNTRVVDNMKKYYENLLDNKVKKTIASFREQMPDIEELDDVDIDTLFGIREQLLEKYNKDFVDMKIQFIEYMVCFDKVKSNELREYIDDKDIWIYENIFRN